MMAKFIAEIYCKMTKVILQSRERGWEQYKTHINLLVKFPENSNELRLKVILIINIV